MGFELKDGKGHLTQVYRVVQSHKGRALAVGLTRQEKSTKILGFIGLGQGVAENFTVPGTHALLYLEAEKLREVARALVETARQLDQVAANDARGNG